MPRALTQLPREDHRLIEKRSCKRRDNNEPPNYQNVSFSPSWAACFFDWSQSHCLSLRYNDVSSCFLVCADSDPMASGWLSALIGYGGRFTARIVFEETKKSSS
jgi:hypothetical protein